MRQFIARLYRAHPLPQWPFHFHMLPLRTAARDLLHLFYQPLNGASAAPVYQPINSGDAAHSYQPVNSDTTIPGVRADNNTECAMPSPPTKQAQ